MSLHLDELVVDNFAGGGGASLGIEMALGRSPDIAVNHDPEAVAMHAENHPSTRHLVGSVWDVDPVAVTRGRRVGLAWFSPDCTFHSKARGAKPFRDPKSAKGRRGLAWVATRWARAVKPRVMVIENVEELQDWGPLGPDGRPDPDRAGFTFRRWVAQLRNCGYAVEWRELRACDYGAPTIRKRLFVIARCDGHAIVWPEPTHGPGRAHPHRTAAECIDWSLSTPSIFLSQEEGRALRVKRPLADKTMARIARGIRRFVLEAAEPFLVPVTHAGDRRVHSIREPMRTVTGAHRGEIALAAPTLIQTGYGERPGQAPRAPGLGVPMGTVVAGGVKHALVAAFLAKHYGGNETPGAPLSKPISTITTIDHHALVASHMLKLHGSARDGRALELPAPTVRAQGTHLAEVRAFLTRYNGDGVDGRVRATGQAVDAPLGTVVTENRFGLVTVAGVDYAIADIGMRMLVPRELFRAQGFPDSYVIDPVVNGERLSATAQVRMCGNSVSPVVARALIAANVGALQAVA